MVFCRVIWKHLPADFIFIKIAEWVPTNDNLGSEISGFGGEKGLPEGHKKAFYFKLVPSWVRAPSFVCLQH
jgi:hypothetical protein